MCFDNALHGPARIELLCGDHSGCYFELVMTNEGVNEVEGTLRKDKSETTQSDVSRKRKSQDC